MNKIFITFIVIIFISILFSCVKDKNVISNIEIVPHRIELISPADSSIYINPTLLYLRWKCDVDDSFNVYFDTHNPPLTLIAQDIKKDSLLLTGLMDTTKYYWKVTADIGEDKSIESLIWKFTTSYSDSTLPIPHAPVPAINSITHKYSDSLKWQCAYAEKYDVYFDSINPPQNRIYTNCIEKQVSIRELRQNCTYYWKIEAKFPDGRQTHGNIWQFHVGTYEIPYVPYFPLPANNSITHKYNDILIWQCEYAQWYDVYFDEINPPENRINTNVTYPRVGILELRQNRTYYWKIVAKFPNGIQSHGDVWQFHVGTFEPPYIPYNEQPPNNATGYPTSLTLSWSCDVEHEVFDVFFGSVNPPTNMIYSTIFENSVPISGLDLNQTYYWKIRTNYPNHEIHEGTVWNFTTTDYVSDMNVRMPDITFNVERFYQYITPTHSQTSVDTINRGISCNMNPITKTFSYQSDTLFFNFYAEPVESKGWIVINQNLNTLDFEYCYSKHESHSEPDYSYNSSTDLKLIFSNLPYSDTGTQMIEANIDPNSLLNYLSGFHYSFHEYITVGWEWYTTIHTGLSIVNFYNSNLKLVLNKNLLN